MDHCRRIALATCANLPDWEVDDAPLHRALIERGVELLRPAWDEVSFDWSGCDAVVIRTTWDYMERRAAFIDWAERAGRVTRLFNPAPIVRWNTHKSYLRDLELAGVPVVPTLWGRAGARLDLREAMHDRGWSRGFIKPAIGATARETMRFTLTGGLAMAAENTSRWSGTPPPVRCTVPVPPVRDVAAAQAHVDRLLRAGEDVLIQPYLSSVETRGEFSAILIDEEITHAVRKSPVPGDYRVQDDFGARDEPCVLPDEHVVIARRAFSAVGDLLGEAGRKLLYARVDCLLGDDGSPRLTEFEAVEPSLFFRHSPAAAVRFADAVIARLDG